MAGEVAFKVVTHPFNVAVMLGVLFSMYQMRLPTTLDTMTEWLANAAAPSALFLLGVTVALTKATAMPREVPYLVVIKLIIPPAAGMGAVVFAGHIRSDVGLRRDRDGGPAAGAEHLRHLDTVQCRGRACLGLRAHGNGRIRLHADRIPVVDPDGTTAARPVSDVG